ncbi:class I SAM-dependent methyltransferase [Ornithinimicrobium kibberense]|uniref:Class I SAM-dependent methyltransferase n=1 Tax=Ornithinimicrobium kibberense TaxID=282060 RepID=A0ABV5V5T7_9MICO|nr:class I SAM-dependent methyltransferase [Ornithinimicrobium kibberense]
MAAHDAAGGLIAGAGPWSERALPRVVDLVLSERVTRPWRERACADAVGTVLEIGFGSGLNLPHYRAGVERVLAAEPSDRAWEIAGDRIAEFGRPVERVSPDAARIPLPDGSVDTVVSTWSLCTVPDVRAALAEARRVLRPDGALHFVEHSRAPEKAVRRVQDAIQPVWGPVAGGCHVTRDVPGLVRAAGFEVVTDEAYLTRFPPARPWAWFVVGTGRPTG